MAALLLAAAEWLPPRNRCWFAHRVVEVRRKYRLAIDRREADPSNGSSRAASPPRWCSTATAARLARWDDNRNGRISCREARRHRIAPVRLGHPAYPFMRDGDGNGVVCE